MLVGGFLGLGLPLDFLQEQLEKGGSGVKKVNNFVLLDKPNQITIRESVLKDKGSPILASNGFRYKWNGETRAVGFLLRHVQS